MSGLECIKTVRVIKWTVHKTWTGPPYKKTESSNVRIFHNLKFLTTGHISIFGTSTLSIVNSRFSSSKDRPLWTWLLPGRVIGHVSHIDLVPYFKMFSKIVKVQIFYAITLIVIFTRYSNRYFSTRTMILVYVCIWL